MFVSRSMASITARQRAILAHFALPCDRMGHVVVWIEFPDFLQCRLASRDHFRRGGEFLSLRFLLHRFHRHQHMSPARLEPRRQGRKQSHAAIGSDLDVCFQRIHATMARMARSASRHGCDPEAWVAGISVREEVLPVG